MFNDTQPDLEVLEQLFLDQVEFRLESSLLLYNFLKHNRKEVLSLLTQLKDLTKENLTLIKVLTYANGQ